MASTFGALKTEVSEALRDPDLSVFDDAAVGRLVNVGVSEVSRLAPAHFIEDITPVEDELDYIILEDVFSAATPEIEVMRVELVDTSQTPEMLLMKVPGSSGVSGADSEAGWTNWGGTLHIPRRIWSLVDGHESDYVYRVQGYAPYAQMSADDDVFGGSDELKWAIVQYAQLVAVRRLIAERELFKQWQARSGNSDITPASLMGDYSRQNDEWRTMKRDLYRPRVRG